MKVVALVTHPGVFRYGSALLSVSAFVLVLLGGSVRATGAGLACPDWPLCFGRAVPEMEWGVIQEVYHRYLAAILSVGCVFFALVSFFTRRKLPKFWSFGKCLLLLLASQIILGGLTVLLLLNPFIVAGHLAFGTIIFQLLVRFSLEYSKRSQPLPRFALGKTVKTLFFVFTLLTFCQIVLGGFVGASGAALVCPDFPHCGESTGLFWTGAHTVQMLHRALALLLFCFALFSWVFVSRAGAVPVPLKRAFILIFGLVCLQALLGTFNVLWRVPVWLTVSHLCDAQLILAVTLHGLRLSSEIRGGFFTGVPEHFDSLSGSQKNRSAKSIPNFETLPGRQGTVSGYSKP